MFYAIHAVVTHNGVTKQVPTFFLDSWIQGIMNLESAERVARRIVDPTEVLDSVHVTAFEHDSIKAAQQRDS
jgi:hypothetical protein